MDRQTGVGHALSQMAEDHPGSTSSLWTRLSENVRRREQQEPGLVQMRGRLNVLREELQTLIELMIQDDRQILNEQGTQRLMGGRGG